MKRANLLTLFQEFARYPDDSAFLQQRGYRHESWTYQRLAQTAAARAQLLSEKGVRNNDRVLLWGCNSAEWAASFWGCLMRGAVVVALDESSTPEFASRVAADAGVKLAFVSGAKPPLKPAVPTLVLEDWPANGGPQLPKLKPGSGSVLAEIESWVASFSDGPITRDHVAEILFTSGTTSEPHGVVLTHGNFLANLEALEPGIEPYRKWEWWVHPLRFVSAVPLSHVFGQFMGLFVPPLLGATVVFQNSTVPAEILRTIQRERAVTLIAVPRMIEALQNIIEHEVDSRGWRKWFDHAYETAEKQSFLRRSWSFRRLHAYLGWSFWAFISGGAALSRETEEFLKRIGYAVVQGYGMTETASLISVNHPFRATEGTVGKVLPGCDFRLAEDGEILVRGENVAYGYWEKGAFRKTADAWLRTGDLGKIDEHGNLRFRGRKKSVIVTPSGLNVYPEDVESALKKQSSIRDAVVLPLQVGRNAEPCAVLLIDRTEPNGGAQPAARKAIDAANATLADYQRVRKWIIWPEPDFPRASTGKPKLAQIAARTGELLDPMAIDSAQSRPLRDVLGLPAGAESLKDLSSLDRVELLSTLERRYNVELSETQFANAKSFAEIEQLLAKPEAHRSDHVYPRWPQSAPVRIFRLLVYYALTWPVTLLLGHPRVIGRQRLDNLNGPALFIANHTTRRADVGLILFALPLRFRHRLATAMAGETLLAFRRPPREWFVAKRWIWQLGYLLVVSLFNVFPLPQLSGFRESFRFAGESVDRGYSVLVFPEGVINDRASPDMIPFQAGIASLAQNLNVPVVPLRLDGVWKMKQEHRRLARLGELTIHIGAPIVVSKEASPKEVAEQLQFAVKYL